MPTYPIALVYIYIYIYIPLYIPLYINPFQVYITPISRHIETQESAYRFDQDHLHHPHLTLSPVPARAAAAAYDLGGDSAR